MAQHIVETRMISVENTQLIRRGWTLFRLNDDPTELSVSFDLGAYDRGIPYDDALALLESMVDATEHFYHVNGGLK